MAVSERFEPRERLRSFGPALAGVAMLLRTQHNARIHAAMSVVVIAAGAGLGVSRLEWCALVLAMAAVWAAEALNTAVEALADAAVPRPDAGVGRAKDAAAAGVLLAAIGAAIVGAIVFAPHLAEVFGG